MFSAEQRVMFFPWNNAVRSNPATSISLPKGRLPQDADTSVWESPMNLSWPGVCALEERNACWKEPDTNRPGRLAPGFQLKLGNFQKGAQGSVGGEEFGAWTPKVSRLEFGFTPKVRASNTLTKIANTGETTKSYFEEIHLLFVVLFLEQKELSFSRQRGTRSRTLISECLRVLLHPLKMLWHKKLCCCCSFTDLFCDVAWDNRPFWSEDFPHLPCKYTNHNTWVSLSLKISHSSAQITFDIFPNKVKHDIQGYPPQLRLGSAGHLLKRYRPYPGGLPSRTLGLWSISFTGHGSAHRSHKNLLFSMQWS